jgi:hypothetical protein
MDALKSLSKPNTGRRSFMWKAGAAVSAALASAVPGMSNHKSNQGSGRDAEVDRLSNQLGILEDEKAIRQLHLTYEALLDTGRYEEVAALFAEDGEAAFNGGVFEGRNGIARLYCDCFRSGLTGKKIGLASGLDSVAEQQQENVKVAADRLSAKAQFSYSIQVGTPMTENTSLAAMARLQGEGIIKWCESGVYEASYAKDAKDGNWKIKRLEYRVAARTDYKPGKLYANSISAPQFAKTYPQDPAGPDRLA